MSAEKKSSKPKLGFYEEFMLGGIAAGISKTAAAPIERVKLLVQNQAEMLKQGRLDTPYGGVTDCFSRTIKAEGFTSLWKGNLAYVLRYFPTQAILPLRYSGVFWHVSKMSKQSKRALHVYKYCSLFFSMFCVLILGFAEIFEY